MYFVMLPELTKMYPEFVRPSSDLCEPQLCKGTTPECYILHSQLHYSVKANTEI